MKHPCVLTAICCFSRWCLLVPLVKRDAPSITHALWAKVFADLAMFPKVIRSDKASEIVGEGMQQINRKLNVRHGASSSYRPQSQGMVDSIRRSLDQEETLLFAQCILRSSPIKGLGGRSRYEVVVGMKPKFPDAAPFSLQAPNYYGVVRRACANA